MADGEMENHAWRVTGIEADRRKSGTYHVHLSNGQSMAVHEDVLVRHRLLKDAVITQSQMAEMQEAALLHEAYAYALRSLAGKPQSVMEMRKKLAKRDYSASVRDQVIRKLLDNKYMDDRDLAVRVSEFRMLSQKKGRRLAALELKQKGVGDEHIRAALEKIDERDEYRAALQLAAKKWQSVTEQDERKKAMKIAAFLLRRGYARHHIFQALKELKANWDAEDASEFEEELPE